MQKTKFIVACLLIYAKIYYVALSGFALWNFWGYLQMNQQELAETLHIHVTHFSKMENEHLLPSIDIVQRLMKVFAVSADNLLNDSENSIVELQNHELNEQLMLINQLDEEEKNALIKIINSMLTKKRMKDLLEGKGNF